MSTGTHSAERLRIIVLGYLVRSPLGGMVWSNLQYLAGLRGLGHDVYYAEDSDTYASCYDPSTGAMSTDPAYGIDFAATALRSIGLGERWCYHDHHRDRTVGPLADQLPKLIASADLVLNLAGVNRLLPQYCDIPHRVYIDQDPAFTQIRVIRDARFASNVKAHNVFFTFGEGIASGTSKLPEDGFAWQSTRQPVNVTDIQPAADEGTGRFTTVMQWKSYSAIEHAGTRYGLKAESFEPFLDLPVLLGPIFSLGVAGRTGRELLNSRGWDAFDPAEISRTPATYEEFIRTSSAEFGIAKHGYVISGSGWFSERSAAYLAHGRPVLAQDTGFGSYIPSGSGVVAFRTPADAVAAARDILDRYQHHSRSAREVAEAFFSAPAVLGPLLERSFASPSGSTPSLSGYRHGR